MREKTSFFCVECGHESAKWHGRCAACGAWNSLEETLRPAGQKNAARLPQVKLTTLGGAGSGADLLRLPSGIKELDRVLGGGLVPGSVVLVGGDPGVGKSTLMLQAAAKWVARGNKVLYISGEESLDQIRLRAKRLGIDSPGLMLLAETDVSVMEAGLLSALPDVAIVDSIQTTYRPEMSSPPGSVSQLKESTSTLLRLAKEKTTAIILIGHVTKEGVIAGPRVLEHLVDCVLYFEGDRQHHYRILRGVKNRFGSTHEIGIFAMEAAGLCEVTNPSEWLLAQRPKNAPGSVVTASMEGSRPLLVEIQALVTPSKFSNPRRMSNGIDINRVALILAVLDRHAGMHILDYDVYVNVVGGVRLVEPAVDLAVAASLVSSFRNRPAQANTIYLGEIGLAGEVRGIPLLAQRLNEGARLGFKRALVPRHSLSSLKTRPDLAVLGVSSINDLLGEE